MNGPGDFERELERELHRVLDPISAAPIPPRRSLNRGISKGLLGGAGAALGVKIATGFAVAALAAAAVTETALTGSLNPADWGQQVTQKVADCKAKIAAAGQHGIGDCVSDFANQHGQLVSGSHKPGGGNGKDKGKGAGAGAGSGGGTSGGTGGGNGNGNGNGNGHKKPPITPPGPTNHHGPPTTAP